jgi:hypothetical protein
MSEPRVDVIDLIDRHPVVGFQIGVLVLCMLVAALDGFDTQAIGYTAPAIAAALRLQIAQFGQVGSAGLFGAAVGALSFGQLADLFGRKWFMILAVVVFAIFSFLTAQAASLEELLAYRFIAGLGLGGATPAFLALGAELAPKRLRDVFVTVLFASFPAGGLIGSLSSAWLIPALGWQSVFYVGAVAPLVIAVILALWLPESVRFLLARNNRQDEVRRTLERIMPGKVPAGAAFVAPGPADRGGPVAHLFTESRAVPTPLLWVPGARSHPRRFVPRGVRRGHVIGGDVEHRIVTRGLFCRRYRDRPHCRSGRNVPDVDSLHWHRMGHGHGSGRPALWPVLDGLARGDGLERGWNLLCCRRAGPDRRVVLASADAGASEHGARRVPHGGARAIGFEGPMQSVAYQRATNSAGMLTRKLTPIRYKGDVELDMSLISLILMPCFRHMCR